MRVLVTGGAGYIGSVVAAQLISAGHEVTVLDDLSTGYADAVPPGAVRRARCGLRRRGPGRRNRRGSHFAAKSLVGESVAEPAKYWSANLGGTLALLDAMREIGVRTIVFSSTAAVYGEPEHTPVTETDPTRPTSPYGATKLAVDTTLAESPGSTGSARSACATSTWPGAQRRPATGPGSASGTARRPI